jgi:hypothetical protein
MGEKPSEYRISKMVPKILQIAAGIVEYYNIQIILPVLLTVQLLTVQLLTVQLLTVQLLI